MMTETGEIPMCGKRSLVGSLLGKKSRWVEPKNIRGLKSCRAGQTPPL